MWDTLNILLKVKVLHKFTHDTQRIIVLLENNIILNQE